MAKRVLPLEVNWVKAHKMKRDQVSNKTRPGFLGSGTEQLTLKNNNFFNFF
jgi:hypothetical protein